MSSYLPLNDIDSIFERIRDESASRSSGIRSASNQRAEKVRVGSVTFITQEYIDTSKLAATPAESVSCCSSQPTNYTKEVGISLLVQ